MVEKQFPTQIGFGGMRKPYNGPVKGVDVVQWVGPSKGQIVGIEQKWGSGEDPKFQFRVTVVLLDDAFFVRNEAGEIVETFESAKGLRITGTKPISGHDKNGDDLSRNLADMFVSAGVYTIEQVNSIREAQAAGSYPYWTPAQAIELLMNRECSVDVGESIGEEDGKPYSNIDNFITSEQYEEKRKTPAMFRRKRSANLSPRGRATTTTTVGAGALGVPQMGGNLPRPPALGQVPPPMPGLPAPAQAAPTPFQAVPPAANVPAPAPSANGLPNMMNLANIGSFPRPQG